MIIIKRMRNHVNNNSTTSTRLQCKISREYWTWNSWRADDNSKVIQPQNRSHLARWIMWRSTTGTTRNWWSSTITIRRCTTPQMSHPCWYLTTPTSSTSTQTAAPRHPPPPLRHRASPCTWRSCRAIASACSSSCFSSRSPPFSATRWWYSPSYGSAISTRRRITS